MAKTVNTNMTGLSSPGNTFNRRVSADSDPFDRNDVDALGSALDDHDHSANKGLPVLRVGTSGAPVSISGTPSAGYVLAADNSTAASWQLPQWKPISHSVLGSTAANVDIQGISSSYRSLRLIVQGRGDAVATNTALRLAINGDGSTLYDAQSVLTQGSAAPVSGEEMGSTSGFIGTLSAASAPANAAGSVDVLIPNSNGTLFKTWHLQSTWKTSNSTGGQGYYTGGGTYRSTSASTRLTVYAASGGLAAGTVVDVYGLST